MRFALRIALPLGALSLAATLSAQQATFDAASIKRHVAPPPPFRNVNLTWPPGGRMAAEGLSLRELVRSAYLDDGIQLVAQVVDGPAWADTDRFDITAKETTPIDGNGDSAALARATLLRALLADRFKLRVHSAVREMPVFDLVFVDARSAGNPRLKPSTCSGFGSSSAPGAPPPCRPSRLVRMDPTIGVTMGFEGMTMRRLAANLAADPEIDRPVRDRTGLTGPTTTN